MRLFAIVAKLISASFVIFPQSSAAMEIMLRPAGQIYTTQAHIGRGMYETMLHTVLIHTPDRAATLTHLSVTVLGGKGELETRMIAADALVATTSEFAGMTEQGLGVFFNAQIVSEGGLPSLFGEEARFGQSAAMNSNEVLALTRQFFTTPFKPTSLTVHAHYLDEQGQPKVETTSAGVQQAIDDGRYAPPVKGWWMVSGFPNLNSHHRFIPSNEFALDFFKRGKNGALDQGVKRDATDDFGYGADVFAVADGEVIYVVNDEVQDPDALSPREGESIADARNRVRRYQMMRYAREFKRASAGNLVVIKHQFDDSVQYSSYGHLKTDSATVKIGQHITKGQKIAEVGNTGDSTLTHLHFQLNDGADPFYSASIPLTFFNAKPRYSGQEPGLFFQFGASEEND